MGCCIVILCCPGGEVYVEDTSYVARRAGNFIVANYSGRNRPDPSIFHPVVGGHHVGGMTRAGFSYEGPQLEFIEHMVLPQGFEYAGTYYPASYSLYSTNTDRIGITGFTTPQMAYAEAKRIIAESGAPPARVASVVYVGSNTGATGEAGSANALSNCGHETVEFDANGLPAWGAKTTKIEFTEQGCRLCGWPGHSATTCNRPDRRYDKIGIEIEGRFLDYRQVQRNVGNDGLTSCGDGSIRRGEDPACQPLEIQTRPDTLARALRQLAKFYPDEADSSCGMHVHVSFKDPMDISLLASAAFGEYFKNRWVAWATRMQLPLGCEFLKRLNSQNQYCRANDGRDFDNPYGADRYLQLNFTAYEEHRTVECRLLPMFREARLGLAAVTELISIYEDWLAEHCTTYLPATEAKNDDADAWTTISQINKMTLRTADYEATLTESSQVKVRLAPVKPVPEGHVRLLLTSAVANTIANLVKNRRAA